jgi:hypothetical protein
MIVWSAKVIEKMGKCSHQRQHHGKCKHDWWDHVDIYTFVYRAITKEDIFFD